MSFEMECPWCEASVEADVTDLALSAVTCPECATTVELAAEAAIAYPIAA